jgi:hypothetical protein
MMTISSQKFCRIIDVVSYFSGTDKPERNDGGDVSFAKLMVYEQAEPALGESDI